MQHQLLRLGQENCKFKACLGNGERPRLNHEQSRAGDVAQWYMACLAYTRPPVQFPAPGNNHKMREEEEDHRWTRWHGAGTRRLYEETECYFLALRCPAFPLCGERDGGEFHLSETRGASAYALLSGLTLIHPL